MKNYGRKIELHHDECDMCSSRAKLKLTSLFVH